MRPRWFSNESANGVYMYNPESQTAEGQVSTTSIDQADLGEPVDMAGNHTVDHGAETRPVNMSVVWIMRVR